MELIERYLQAVKFWLPEAQKEDIAAELSEDIDAQIAEREVALARPVAEDEIAAILQKLGHPLVVANRYAPSGHLIGPTLYPLYIFVLKVVLAVTVLPVIFSRIGLAIWGTAEPGQLQSWWHAIGAILGATWTAGFAAAAAVTAAFAALERVKGGTLFLEKWDPRKLPALRHPNVIPRNSAVFELALNLGMLVFFAVSLRSPVTFFPGVTVTLAPIWGWFYWGLLVSAAGATALAAVSVWRPYWTLTRAWARLAVDAFGSAMFIWLMRANVLAGFSYAGATPEKSLEIAQTINFWSTKLAPWAVFMGLLVLAGNGYHVWRLRRKQASFHATASLCV